MLSLIKNGFSKKIIETIFGRTSSISRNSWILQRQALQKCCYGTGWTTAEKSAQFILNLPCIIKLLILIKNRNWKCRSNCGITLVLRPLNLFVKLNDVFGWVNERTIMAHSTTRHIRKKCASFNSFKILFYFKKWEIIEKEIDSTAQYRHKLNIVINC